MLTWFAANGATYIIALILLALVFFAVRKVLKNKGGCNCGHCTDCNHCSKVNTDEKKDND